MICSARKSTLLWYELLIYQAWKPSVWQNPYQVRTNQNARIYLNTALLYNKLIYLFTGNQAIQSARSPRKRRTAGNIMIIFCLTNYLYEQSSRMLSYGVFFSLNQETKKTRAVLVDDTYFCHSRLNIKKTLLITNK